MIDFTTLYRSSENNRFYAFDGDEKVEIADKFPIEDWDSVEAFESAHIRGYEPMTAKELETEEEQDKCLNNPDYYVEEKFDGTRAIVQFFSQETVEGDEIGYARVFSRRISKKTGFYVENSDSVPQIRDINIPEMSGTILDGEMFINGRPFRDVSSTLNCLWDKAIDRQLELGFISLHAFDIIKYKGIDMRRLPLHRRKHYLEQAIEEINSPYIELVPYFDCGEDIPLNINEVSHRLNEDKTKVSKFFKDLEGSNRNTYPNLYDAWLNHTMSPRAYYEMIVATGGEGVIVKPKNGQYHHKRGWEYSKIKKFLTREMILMGFDEPTKEYTGKAPKDWAYYEDGIPVTKHYYNRQVGNLILGVLITQDEYNSLKSDKQGKIFKASDFFPCEEPVCVMEVCECGGFDDETRAYFTRNKDRLIGSVVEVKANEIMKDSGRLRHPRYLRMRDDKEPERCIWADHIAD